MNAQGAADLSAGSVPVVLYLGFRVPTQETKVSNAETGSDRLAAP